MPPLRPLIAALAFGLITATQLAPPASAQATLASLLERCNSGQDYAACRDLGRMRARGEGAEPRDLVRALQFLDEACRAGLDDACVDYRSLNETGALALPTHGPPPDETRATSTSLPMAPATALPADMVLVHAGTFTMGSRSREAGRDSDETQFRVTLTRDFWVSRTEVTQGEYESLMGHNPSYFYACGSSCPVEQVSWLDAVAFANARSVAEGLTECYNSAGLVSVGTVYACNGYRLPTEAEWEYAARAGTTGSRYGEIDEIAWYASNSGSRTRPVCGKVENSWGLCDVLGNVWEWCHDTYGWYPVGPVADPVSETGSRRILRGSSWNFEAQYARSAYRYYRDDPSYRSASVGFRLARTAP